MSNRKYAGMAAVMAVLAAVCGSAFAEVEISVGREQGAFRVRAEFTAGASTGTVRDVLADYEHIPRFVDSVSESRVAERGDGYIVIEQKGREGAMLLFSREIHLLLRVREEGGRIAFEDLLRRDFSVYDGSWEFSPEDGRTRITYSLNARPSFFVPGFMAREIFRMKGKHFCEEILAEIRRRARERAPADVPPGG